MLERCPNTCLTFREAKIPLMQFKIYFGAKPLFLCDRIGEELELYVHRKSTVLMEEKAAPAIQSILQEIEHPGIQAAILVHKDIEELQQEFWKKFTVLKAGGGAVWNDQKQLLFIHRRGKWDLPKGKLDEGETIEECAVREVEEETGLVNPTIVQPIITTYHTYRENGNHLLKESYWYEMNVRGAQTLRPQEEEQITETTWLSPVDWQQVRANTFPSILDVLDRL